MEEVVDHTQATSSPKALANHFLLRHAECRKALTSLTVEDSAREALQHLHPDAPLAQSAMASSPRSGECLSSADGLAAGVTEDDSCAARYSRAYAAARHNLARHPLSPPSPAG